MTDQQRRRLRSQPSARPAGAPNVLSNEAKPNTLSTMGRTSGGIIPAAAPTKGSAGPATASVQPVRPTIATGRPAAGQRTATDDRFERPRRRPTLGTVIFIGFVIFWAARLFNGAGVGSGPTSTPRPTTAHSTFAPVATPHATKGQVVFGEVADGANCGLEKRASRFTIAAEVYWEAEMKHIVVADATVVVIEKHDNIEIDRQEIPPDPDVGSWARFCAGGPVAGYQTGVYRIEIWNEDTTELLSSGSFTRYDATATPTPRPTPRGSNGPLPTVLGSQTGRVTFGTAVGADCALAGIADTFGTDEAVWWRAELTKPLPADMDVRLLTMVNGATVTNTVIPSASIQDPRSVVCAGAPTAGKAAGFVYVQIWSVDQQDALAFGIFERRP